MRISSPSATSAISPPSAASGETCPTERPEVAPEKRPSVTSAQAVASPAALMRLVGMSISCMPGPPRGPS